MKVLVIMVLVTLSSSLCAQNYDGFIVTTKDSIYKGYMRFVSGGNKGLKLLITNDKKKKPREILLSDIKYYSYKKDTFAILRDFYPFENTEYSISQIEAKIEINNGTLKLYSASIPEIEKSISNSGIGYYSYSGAVGSPGLPMGTQRVYNTDEDIFIVRDKNSYLIGVRKKKKEFVKAMETLIGDDLELLNKVRSGELKFKDTKKIIALYNSKRDL